MNFVMYQMIETERKSTRMYKEKVFSFIPPIGMSFSSKFGSRIVKEVEYDEEEDLFHIELLEIKQNYDVSLDRIVSVLEKDGWSVISQMERRINKWKTVNN
jgi:hypothetical protein